MSVPPIYASQLFALKLSAIVGQSLLVYDYLLTLPLEAACFWNGPWTLVKALFLFNRYGTLFGQIVITMEEMGYLSHGSQQICYAFQFYITAFSVLSGETIRLLVVMRACAILGCKRSLAWFLQMLYILYTVGLLAAILFLNSRVRPQYVYLSETGVCFAPVPPNGWTFWPVLAFIDTIVVVTVCYNLWQLSGGFRGVYSLRLFRLLARDALLFYFTALFSVLYGVFSWTIDGQNPKEIIQSMIAVPLLSIVGQHVILNLRGLRARPDSTSDLSREVNRQIASVVEGFSLDEVGHGTIRMTDLYHGREDQRDTERDIQ